VTATHYQLETVRDLIERFGSIEKAENEARSRSGFGEDIRAVDSELSKLRFYGSADHAAGAPLMTELRARRRTLIVAALTSKPKPTVVAVSETKPAKRGSGRAGKEYEGEAVEEIVRLASRAQMNGEYLGRTLRNRIAGDAQDVHPGVKVTRYEVDLVCDLMGNGKLADAGRAGSLVIQGQLTVTPAYINLSRLTNGSARPSTRQDGAG
jgi:hypothetical protein